MEGNTFKRKAILGISFKERHGGIRKEAWRIRGAIGSPYGQSEEKGD